jgi:hypothetical protein
MARYDEETYRVPPGTVELVRVVKTHSQTTMIGELETASCAIDGVAQWTALQRESDSQSERLLAVVNAIRASRSRWQLYGVSFSMGSVRDRSAVVVPTIESASGAAGVTTMLCIANPKRAPHRAEAAKAELLAAGYRAQDSNPEMVLARWYEGLDLRSLQRESKRLERLVYG